MMLTDHTCGGGFSGCFSTPQRTASHIPKSQILAQPSSPKIGLKLMILHTPPPLKWNEVNYNFSVSRLYVWSAGKIITNIIFEISMLKTFKTITIGKNFFSSFCHKWGILLSIWYFCCRMFMVMFIIWLARFIYIPLERVWFDFINLRVSL